MRTITVLDTILRDGAQAEGISFSLEDKLKIVHALDGLGVSLIEAGNPASNPKDAAFFREAVPALRLQTARIAAFGSTRRMFVPAGEDPGIQALRDCPATHITLFGKSWDFHVTHVLRTTLAENLAMIRDSVAYLTSQGKTVYFDAEHFFDGYKADPEYALQTLLAAQEAGAVCAVLCETNGGCLPQDVQRITREVVSRLEIEVGIHTHNDGGMAVASSVLAVEAGARHVQGTLNGFGERSGNADLCTLLPTLALKMDCQVLPEGALCKLTETSRFISEVANVAPDPRAPYVGASAFAHKGGMHVDGVLKASASFEHIDPALVGNQRRLLLSEVSGRAVLLTKLQDYAPEIGRDAPELRQIIEGLKRQELAGYRYEDAEGSFALMVLETLGRRRRFFEVLDFSVLAQKPWSQGSAQAIIKVRVGEQEEMTAAEGEGPVNALDAALRKALTVFYPEIAGMRLSDFKVRVLDSEGTASTTRVKIESTNGRQTWGTVGVSTNIIDASWQALIDSIDYLLTFHRAEA